MSSSIDLTPSNIKGDSQVKYFSECCCCGLYNAKECNGEIIYISCRCDDFHDPFILWYNQSEAEAARKREYRRQCDLEELAEADAFRKMAYQRMQALFPEQTQFPKESLCYGCADRVGICYSEKLSLEVTEKKHGLRVYTLYTDPCPHRCIVCETCTICQDLTDPYEYDDIEADIDDLGEYGCPKVEPVRNHTVKSKPKTVSTSAPVKVKTKYPVKPESSRLPHIRTHA
jgi:hypothetical protein